MRVIAGEFRGRKLVAPDTLDTRPVTDRVKEAVFSALGERNLGARVADLYAGAGSFGIEALSRGAASVVFVEMGRKAKEALRSNLTSLGIDSAVVAPVRVERFLKDTDRTFDLVFCDPPWSMPSSELTETLSDVVEMLDPDGAVVVSRRASDPVPEPVDLVIDDERRYGDTRIIRYTKATP